MTEKLRQLHRIKHTVWRYAALARHLDAPMHMIQFANGVRIGIDAEDAAVVERCLMPAPVKIKTPGVRVYFDGDPILPAGFENFIDVDVIARTALKLPACHVADN